MLHVQRLTRGVLVVGILAMVLLAACTETPPDPPTRSDPPPTIAPPAGSPDTTSAGVTALMDKLSTWKPPAQGSRAAAIVREAAKPVAESSMIERNSSTEATGAKPVERGGIDKFDPTQVLAPVDAEVPKVWIGWYVNRVIDAFRQAIDLNKPLVLVVAEGWCDYCVNLAYNSLRCAAVDRFAGDAVFAYSFPTADKGAVSIAGSLKIERYPTITVLEPESRLLLERGRINGYFDGDRMGGYLDTLLWKTPARVLPPDWDGTIGEQRSPSPAPPSVTSTPRPNGPATVANSLFGAAKLGLQHAAPVPKC